MTRILLTGGGLDGVAAALSGEGEIDVARAPDTVAALEHLETGGADLVVAPADPGGLTGRQFVRELRSRGHGHPVVLLAAEDLRSALDADAEAVVPADDPREAARRIRDVLARHRLDAERTARRQQRAAASAARAAVAGADTRAGVEGALVDAIVDSNVYRSGWFGRVDATADAVVPTAAAGLPTTHVGEVPVEGATATAVDGEVAVRREGERVTVVVPVGEEPLGVLYVNADRPAGVDDAERDMLADLGTAAATAVERVETGDVDAAGFSVLGDTLAHELSNHLDVATMHLDLARDRDDAEEHFAHVEDALERMADLADEARALARGDVETEPCDLAAVAEDAWAGVETDGADLRTEDGSVDADPDLLGLLLENLFRNSIEHGTADEEQDPSQAVEYVGDLTVRVEPLDGGFAVADDGTGIPEHERERVLEWGYSGGEGDGVGLGVVRVVAERHDWSVSVEESAEGGARFVVQ